MQTLIRYACHAVPSVDDRRRPLLSVRDRWSEKCDLNHICISVDPADRQVIPAALSALTAGVGWQGQHGLSHPAGTVDGMGNRKRASGPKPNYGRSAPGRRPPAAPSSSEQRDGGPGAGEVLKQIKRVRLVREQADAELARLVDRAVGLGIGWPKIAAELGVTRQAARQQYQRRHPKEARRDNRAA